MKDKSGIYQIKNLFDGKVYVGQAINLRTRKNQHFSNLKRNEHRNPHLQRSYNKYGSEYFVFEIIVYCESFELTRYEQCMRDANRNNCYNVRECVNSNLGIKMSDESKARMSIAKKNPSDETRRRMSDAKKGIPAPNKGVPMREETKTKLHNANIGKIHPREQNDKMSILMSGENNPFYGEHHSEEALQKMSDAKKGKPSSFKGKHHSEESLQKMSEAHKNPSQEIRDKISNARLGTHASDETRQKMSDSSPRLSGEDHYNFGKHLSKEWKEKISISNTGRKSTPETNKKISQANQGRHNKNSKNKYVGVTFVDQCNMWRVTFVCDGVKYALGYFKYEVEGALAYNQAALEFHGWKAKLNIITQEEIDALWEMD